MSIFSVLNHPGLYLVFACFFGVFLHPKNKCECFLQVNDNFQHSEHNAKFREYINSVFYLFTYEQTKDKKYLFNLLSHGGLSHKLAYRIKM